MNAGATQRLFFALWPDDAVRERCAMTARSFGDHAGKRVVANNLHLTLCFIGSADETTRQCLETAADAITCEPTTLWLDRLGYFPRPQVLWLGAAQTPPPLQTLASEITRAAQQCGVSADVRPFVPHMTLLRKVRRAPKLPAIEPIAWPVTSFCLVQSETRPEGPVYSVLREWHF